MDGNCPGWELSGNRLHESWFYMRRNARSILKMGPMLISPTAHKSDGHKSDAHNFDARTSGG